MPPESNTSQNQTKPEPWFVQPGGYLVGPGFLLMALLFLTVLGDYEKPVARSPSVEMAALSAGAYRESMLDPPTARIGGFDQRCNECHQIVATTWDSSRPLTQHRHIRMNHGSNDHCANCHARENREHLVLRDNTEIGFSESSRLCQQCHGPVYRDWSRGTHGKTLGSWISGSPNQLRLRCVQCHDPHSPSYEPLPPLPGPNTLRMGDQQSDADAAHGSSRNPLMRWRQSQTHRKQTSAPVEAHPNDQHDEEEHH